MKNINIPGSKSITNRVLLLASLCDTPTILHGALESDDTRYLRESLVQFGVKFVQKNENTYEVIPPKKFSPEPGTNCFIGNSGTSSRFLAALCLITDRPFVIDGVPRMCERPFEDLFTALRQAPGVEIKEAKNAGFLPATFTGSDQSSPIEISISGRVSSQFISGMLLVGASTTAGLTIHITDSIPSLPYVLMTVEILKIWNIDVTVSADHKKFTIKPGLKSPGEYQIPADSSGASYPVAFSLLKKEPICIDNFGANTLQGDEAFLQFAETLGAQVTKTGDQVVVTPGNTMQNPDTYDFEAMPDVSMTGMILSAFAAGSIRFTGLESLRVKECDRIQAMAEGLQKIGIKIEIEGDDMIVHGNPDLQIPNTNFEIDSYDDHRIAFCFGLVRSIWGGKFTILDDHCVSKTWPNYWADLADWSHQLRPVAGIILHRIGTNCRKTKYLIVKKPRKNHAWQFPQGGQDTGETLSEAAVRELQEECGSTLTVDINPNPTGNYSYLFPTDFVRPDHQFLGANVTFFRASLTGGTVEIDNHEIIDYAWATADQLPEYFEPTYLAKVQGFLG